MITDIEKHGDIWIKRDDKFEYHGVNGGKIRTCLHMAQGATGLITAGSRQSPQVNIVATIAHAQGIPCRVHVPWAGKEYTPELLSAERKGAKIIMHKPGYNSVIISRAKKDALDNPDYTYIPFGMECVEAVEQTATQVVNIPPEVKRIVVPVGSGMSFSGVVSGMVESGLNIPILGVRVGADPNKRISKYAPFSWGYYAKLVTSDLDYHTHFKENVYDGVVLDPVYEAKCIPFLQKDDMLWVVGIRETSK